MARQPVRMDRRRRIGGRWSPAERRHRHIGQQRRDADVKRRAEPRRRFRPHPRRQRIARAQRRAGHVMHQHPRALAALLRHRLARHRLADAVRRLHRRGIVVAAAHVDHRGDTLLEQIHRQAGDDPPGDAGEQGLGQAVGK